MDQTHLHLLLNHVPLFGLVFGLLILILGFFRRSDELKLAAAILFLISAVVLFPVQQTGEEAEHTVEELAGVNHDDLEAHEDAAEFATPVLAVLGLISIYAMWQYRKRKSMPNGISIAMLVIALFGFTIIARTAYLGGFIRHTEIHGGAAVESDDHDEKSGKGKEDK